MRSSMSHILLVTGGLGFIGKHFIKIAHEQGHFIINVDHINYAADRTAHAELAKLPNYHFIESDIATLEYLPECDYIVNFAESHVDNSISSISNFCHSNYIGVQHLLDLLKSKQQSEQPVFLQISTDEVYGDVTEGFHTEDDKLIPSNPYSATKAAADLLIQSYARTHGIKHQIVRPTNNYGCNQYPEKLIPKSASRMKRGKPAIMHGDGTYVRCWLHAEDTSTAILTVINKGELNTIYNIAGDLELQNIEVLRKIANILNVPESNAWISTENRSGQDIRYSLDDSKIRSLGWKPTKDFDVELKKIVQTEDFRHFILDVSDTQPADTDTATGNVKAVS